MPCTAEVSPYFHLIQRYFPEEQWEVAQCLSLAECCPDRADYPACMDPQGSIDCGAGPVVNASSFGLFGILDACWNPAMNPASPFNAATWEDVLDPEINTWMASVIYSYASWSAWTICGQCPPSCTNPGPPPEGQRWEIPYPDAPFAPEPPRPSLVPVAALAVGVGVYLLMASRARR